MHIKITVRHYLTLIRMSLLEERNVEKLAFFFMRIQDCTITEGNSLVAPQNLRQSLCDVEILLQDRASEEFKVEEFFFVLF